MNADGGLATRTGWWGSLLSLFASSSTLVCCALPALLVALGAGAALSSVMSVFPQLVWLSEHKLGLFGFAGLALTASSWQQWRNRSSPCPVDPALRRACMKTRKTSLWVYAFSVLVFLLGAWFAFVLPWLAE